MIGAYILKFETSGKFYIGSAKDITARIARHVRDLKSGLHHNTGVQEQWDKKHPFTELVYPTDTREEAFEIEQHLLDVHKGSPNLLNVGLSARGGDNLTKNPNRQAIIEKIKDTLMEMFNGMSPELILLKYSRAGSKNGMFGKTHSAEARAKISAVNKGVTRRSGFKLSKEHRKMISENASKRTGSKNPFFGKKHSEETRKRLSEAIKAKGMLPGNSRTVLIDGKTYPSINAASRDTGISPALLVYRLQSKSKKYSGYNYL